MVRFPWVEFTRISGAISQSNPEKSAQSGAQSERANRRGPNKGQEVTETPALLSEG